MSNDTAAWKAPAPYVIVRDDCGVRLYWTREKWTTERTSAQHYLSDVVAYAAGMMAGLDEVAHIVREEG